MMIRPLLVVTLFAGLAPLMVPSRLPLGAGPNRPISDQDICKIPNAGQPPDDWHKAT